MNANQQPPEQQPLIKPPRTRLKTPEEISADRETRALEARGGVEPTTWERYRAGFVISNPMFDEYEEPSRPIDAGYDPYDEPDELEDYPLDAFRKARSALQTQDIKANIDRQRQLERDAEDTAAGVMGGVMGSIVDPFMLPGLALAPAALLPAMALEAVGATASELYRESKLYDHAWQEGVANVVLAAGFVGVVGAGSKVIKGGYTRRLIKEYEEYDATLRNLGVEDSVGARRADSVPLEETAMAGGRAAELGTLGPGSRVASAHSRVARATMQRMSDPGMVTREHQAGTTFGPSVESISRKYEGLHALGIQETKSKFKAYRVRMKAEGSKPLKSAEFDEQVGIAMSSRDQHAIPEVAEQATWYRARLEPMAEDARKMGLLPKYKDEVAADFAKAREKASAIDDTIDEVKWRERIEAAPERGSVTGADSYFPRVYDPQKVYKGYTTLKARIARHFAGGETEYLALDAGERLTIDNAAASTITNMLGGTPIEYAAGGAAVPSSLKKRVLTLSDAELQPYRELRATRVMGTHFQRFGPYLEMHRRFGDAGLKDQLSAINREYEAMVKKATDGGADAKIIEKLNKERDQVLKDVQHVRDRVLGEVRRSMDPGGIVSRLIRGTKAFNVSTQLGGIVLSSLPDAATPIMRAGLRSYGKAVKNVLIDKIFRTDRGKATRAAIQRMGLAIERTVASRGAVNNMLEAGQGDFASAVTDIWGKVTLFNNWTDFMEEVAARAISDKWLRVAARSAGGKTVSKAMRGKLARAGLSTDDLNAIGRELDAGNKGDLWDADPANWTDKGLAQRYEAALSGETRNTILRPGAADLPTYMDNEYAGLLMQYKSFMMTAHNRLTIQGLQNHDLDTAMGLVGLVGLGAVVEASKMFVRGEDPTKMTPDQVILGGVDRSGVLGLMNMGINAARFALASQAGIGKMPARYLIRDAESVLGGPTVGNLGRVARIGGDIMSGEADRDTLKQAERLTPFAANTLHLRQILETMAE